jgi:hypothetical protein
MANSGRKLGGGYGSRVNVEKPVRVGDRAKVVNPLGGPSARLARAWGTRPRPGPEKPSAQPRPLMAHAPLRANLEAFR